MAFVRVAMVAIHLQSHLASRSKTTQRRPYQRVLPTRGVFHENGNLTRKGYDVPAEIRFLKNRIASIHFKDGKSYLGEGEIEFEPIAAAIVDIGYQGWIVLETAAPSNDAVADAKRNAAYVRKLFQMS